MPTSTSDRGGLTIRAATAADGERVRHLWEDLQTLHAEADSTNYRPPGDPRNFQDYFDAALSGGDWDILVAARNGKVVGYIVLREIQREPDFLHCARHWLDIEHLSIAESARRSGVAAALLEQARRIAQRRGIDQIKVGVRAFNAGAVNAYERMGFGHDFHQMSLTLDHGRKD